MTSFRIELADGVTWLLIKNDPNVKNGFVGLLNDWAGKGWITVQVQEVENSMLITMKKEAGS